MVTYLQSRLTSRVQCCRLNLIITPLLRVVELDGPGGGVDHGTLPMVTFFGLLPTRSRGHGGVGGDSLCNEDAGLAAKSWHMHKKKRSQLDNQTLFQVGGLMKKEGESQMNLWASLNHGHRLVLSQPATPQQAQLAVCLQCSDAVAALCDALARATATHERGLAPGRTRLTSMGPSG